MKRVFVSLAAAALSGCTLFGPERDPAGRADGEYYFDTAVRLNPPIENSFIGEPVTVAPLPDPEVWTRDVPEVFWDGHDDVARTFAASWRMLGEKLHAPEKGTNFKRNYVYTPFGNSVFVWGSCFITMFGKYAMSVFPFIEQLDNFYAAQAPDGFIPRQLGIYDGRSQFAPDDPSSAGGIIFAWAELGWYRHAGDRERLARVYPVLLAYHRWFARKRTWKDGTYFCSGWGCGMDNIVRSDAKGYSPSFEHGHLSFVDVTLQQVFDAKNLLAIAKVLEKDPPQDLVDEISSLTRIANERMWDPEAGVYKDLDRAGSRVGCAHVGGFWAFLAGVASQEKGAKMIAELEDPARFAAPCGTRSTVRGGPGYEPDGGSYWCGGVWAITDYAIVKGLDEVGETDAAFRLAKRQVEAFAKVYDETGTVWESYDPERVAQGKLCGKDVRRDFVGFSGVAPIALLIEDVFGITVENGEVAVRPKLTERYGIRNLVLANGERVSIEVEARKSADEKPVVHITKEAK